MSAMSPRVLNGFSCSGLYDCDLGSTIEAVSRIAVREWNNREQTCGGLPAHAIGQFLSFQARVQVFDGHLQHAVPRAVRSAAQVRQDDRVVER